MAFKHALLTLAFSTALASAASSSELPSVYLLNLTPVPLAGSIITSDATATTYHIACTPASLSPLCGFAHGATYVAADNGDELTFWNTVEGSTFSGQCTFTTRAPHTTTSALCTNLIDGFGSGFADGVTRTGWSEVEYLIPLTVTAGPSSGASSAVEAGATSTSSSSSSSTSSADSEEGSEEEEGATATGDEGATPTGGVGRLGGTGLLGLGLALGVGVLGAVL